MNREVRSDQNAYSQITISARSGNSVISSFIFNRWGPTLTAPSHWSNFLTFLSAMHNLDSRSDAILRQRLMYDSGKVATDASLAAKRGLIIPQYGAGMDLKSVRAVLKPRSIR